ncbi:Oxygen-dependent choline dehydrogenase [Cladobotryum mycophilum]|uniref:Oxygen-dependent choline dehydrogenase n=1 Tax=Cladobotryum mycophilum TaxID=491253 RepID=A0ABR0SJB8_9HYPO
MWPFSDSYPQLRPEDVNGKTFDYIIVGGGTAGCVLASRLSEDPTVSILVIERGLVENNWMSRVPLLSLNFHASTSPAVKDRYSVPIMARGGYKLQLVTGQILGGTSRINSTLSTRGAAGGYNDWAESLGLTDWSWDKVEPHFKSLETAISAPDDPSRGHQGPLRVRLVPEAHEWFSYMGKPCQALGLPICRDVNSSKAPAQGYFNIDSAINLRSQRESAFSAFLNEHIAIQRGSHLSVCTGTVATKLELDAEKGTVTGVHIRLTGGAGPDHFVKAQREVIICSGAFGTPSYFC